MARLMTSAWSVVALVLLLLGALVLMSDATQDSARFSEIYSTLLVVCTLGLIFLAILIVANLWRLRTQVRRDEAGARLTFRMIVIFVLLSLPPVFVVYYFSLQVLHRGIDSWFDVRIESALTDALELGRTSLGIRMREQLRQTESLGLEIEVLGREGLTLALATALTTNQAAELTVLSDTGAIVASSSSDPTKLVPHQANSSALLQVSPARSFVGLEPVSGAGLHVRAVVELSIPAAGGQRFFLQALYPVAERMNELAETVQTAYAKYRELAYLRDPLKFSFTLTLSLVLVLSIFTAVWTAFLSARRMVAPLRSLAAGTQAVAEGDYGTRLGEPARNDELGFLVTSFNDMTSRLRSARDETRQSQGLVEEQRTYLEAVLARMSSGVMTIDGSHHVVTANDAAGQILGVPQDRIEGANLAALAANEPRMQPLVELLQSQFSDTAHDWRTELTLFGPNGRQVLICRGTRLPSPHTSASGYVVVFDDMTALIQAERNAAWSEVARRLAHEIKNPLTPIQLSAERLRHKYLGHMSDAEGATLDRLTRTIVNQVESMKEMVNAFSDYARSPTTQPETLDLNALIADVAALYGAKLVMLALDRHLPTLEADPNRLRQVLHNLIKNANEAGADNADQAATEIETRVARTEFGDYVELEVRDHGPGIPEQFLASMFEPYVSNKTRGTGLGLAIVKKIVEEHGGRVSARNNQPAGASIVIQLPLRQAEGQARGSIATAEAGS
jgi:PAS domain S-box-containing protein